MTEVDAFDQPSLEAFTSGLVAAGFEPEPDSDRRTWKGPIHPAFKELTDAPKMRVKLRDGWPFVFPVLFVDGLHTRHLTEHGFVCLWHEGDDSGEWITVDGFLARIESWCAKAKAGWDEAGLARDAYLNFTRKLAVVAIYDLDDLRMDNPGSWGTFLAGTRLPFQITLRPIATDGKELRGLWFHVGSVDIPPRNLAELRDQLNREQRKGLVRALAQRASGDVLDRSGGVDLIAFRWDRADRRHLLILGLEGVGNDIVAKALQDGPSDEQSLLLRAGPDSGVLLDKSVAVFGLGALGGHAAVCLASSGLGQMRVIDSDQLLPGNVARHVAGHAAVGLPKAQALKFLIRDHAPWTSVDDVVDQAPPRSPARLTELVGDVDLVVDATGVASITASLAAVAAALHRPLVSAGLFRGGAVARVQRQGMPGDTLIAARTDEDRYPRIPAGRDEDELVEPAVGCSAPVNNAPPASALACAALLTQAAIDVLTDRCALPDELVEVYRVLPGELAFQELGRHRS